MTRKRGEVTTPIDLAPVPCKPASPQDICMLCTRRDDDIPSDPFKRPNTVLIDASTLAELESCPMFMGKAVPVRWWNAPAEVH